MAAVDRHRGIARTYVTGHNSRAEHPRNSLRHGMFGTPTYRSWLHMKERCTNSRCHAYASYGGRGITVCERWSASFENFLADMGKRPDGKTLDRIDNDGNYEPSNCRWATASEQRRNQRPRVRA
jgi:hypothetical protein